MIAMPAREEAAGVARRGAGVAGPGAGAGAGFCCAGVAGAGAGFCCAGAEGAWAEVSQVMRPARRKLSSSTFRIGSIIVIDGYNPKRPPGVSRKDLRARESARAGLRETLGT